MQPVTVSGGSAHAVADAMAMIDAALTKADELHAAADTSELAKLRNPLLKRMTCPLCEEKQTILTIATLPYLHFASGHTFFTQSLQVCPAALKRRPRLLMAEAAEAAAAACLQSHTRRPALQSEW